MNSGAKRWLLLAIAAALGVSLCSSYFNNYYLGVAVDVGINVILAVSLNLINGYTGQFSLGHAGFMAVGAYTSWPPPFRSGQNFSRRPLEFPLGLFCGGRIGRGRGRIDCGCALFAAKRRLSRHCDFGLRGNHPRHFPKLTVFWRCDRPYRNSPVNEPFLDLGPGSGDRVHRGSAGEFDVWARLSCGARR